MDDRNWLRRLGRLALALVPASVRNNRTQTKSSGRISRKSFWREWATAGSALRRPVKKVLRSSDSQKSSAVCPKAMTLAPRPRAIS